MKKKLQIRYINYNLLNKIFWFFCTQSHSIDTHGPRSTLVCMILVRDDTYEFFEPYNLRSL